MLDALIEKLTKLSIKLEEKISLREYSSFRIGGRGTLGIFPDSIEQLNECVRLCKSENCRYFIVGRGSNILFGDGDIQCAFIFTEKLSRLRVLEDEIYAEAGVSLAALANTAARHGLTGLEFARGIPGSVGGAVFMNAGAYGGAMSDVTVASTALNVESGEVFDVEEHNFGYRHSIYSERKELICLGAKFRLTRGNIDEINQKMSDLALQRREKQPLNLPSAGSYFKRPEGYFAAKLIDDAGLKGMCIGDACVSEKHAGFIVNLGNATAADVLTLEEMIRKEVAERFGVVLEREIIYID